MILPILSIFLPFVKYDNKGVVYLPPWECGGAVRSGTFQRTQQR